MNYELGPQRASLSVRSSGEGFWMYNSESRSRLSGMIRFPSPGTGKAHGGLNVGVARPAGHGLMGWRVQKVMESVRKRRFMSIRGLFDLEIVNMISSTVRRNVRSSKRDPIRAL